MRGFRVPAFVLAAAIIGVTYLGSTGRVDARPVAATHPYVTIGIIAQGAPINWYNTQPLQWAGLDVSYLGIVKLGVSNPLAFYPSLAKSWKTSKNGRSVTVTLQPNARWSNGKQITSNDLISSAAISFASGGAQSIFLGSVKALNSKTVVYKMAPGAKYNLFTRGVLEQVVTPKSVFGHLLPKDIWTTIKASQYAGTDPTLVQKQKDAVTTLQALYKKIQAYAPAKDVSSGPYVLKSYNSGEAILVKNKYFYAASKIHIPEVILRNYNNDNQQIWNYLLGGQVYQATSGGMSSSLVHRIAQVPNNHEYLVPSTASAQLIWNESVSPYNKLAVRQALAYLINRKLVQKVGEPVSGTYNHWPTNAVDSNTKAYLSKAQLKQLNPYNPSPKAAASLLTKAGFKQSGGHWMLPNGQPWTVTLTTVNGFNDWVEAAAEIKSELSQAGITTEVQLSPSYAQYLTDLAAGKVSFGFWIGTGTTPYGMMGRLYAVPDGYNLEGGKLLYFPPTASGKGNWLGFPQSVNVKGYGKVAVGPLTNKLNVLTDKKKIRTIMQTLMITTNQKLPELTLWNYEQVGFVNDKYFTDYPTKNVKLMWTCSGYYPPIGCWQELGYVRPR